jgi:hypothetical protein
MPVTLEKAEVPEGHRIVSVSLSPYSAGNAPDLVKLFNNQTGATWSHTGSKFYPHSGNGDKQAREMLWTSMVGFRFPNLSSARYNFSSSTAITGSSGTPRESPPTPVLIYKAVVTSEDLDDIARKLEEVQNMLQKLRIAIA